MNLPVADAYRVRSGATVFSCVTSRALPGGFGSPLRCLLRPPLRAPLSLRSQSEPGQARTLSYAIADNQFAEQVSMTLPLVLRAMAHQRDVPRRASFFISRKVNF